MILRIESNILEGCEWLETLRRFSAWDTDDEIVTTLKSVVSVLSRFEEAYSMMVAESEVFEKTFPAFDVMIRKNSDMSQSYAQTKRLGSEIAYNVPESCS